MPNNPEVGWGGGKNFLGRFCQMRQQHLASLGGGGLCYINFWPERGWFFAEAGVGIPSAPHGNEWRQVKGSRGKSGWVTDLKRRKT